MAKLKTCSFCGTSSKLFYAKPPCCTRGSCLMQYKNQKHEKKDVARKADDRTKATVEPSRKKKPKGIAPISKRRSEELKGYRKVRDKFMKDNPYCKSCGGEATDLHHGAGRTGKLLTDVRYFVPLCRPCHSYFETHPEEARDKGISFSRLDK